MVSQKFTEQLLVNWWSTYAILKSGGELRNFCTWPWWEFLLKFITTNNEGLLYYWSDSLIKMSKEASWMDCKILCVSEWNCLGFSYLKEVSSYCATYKYQSQVSQNIEFVIFSAYARICMIPYLVFSWYSL